MSETQGTKTSLMEMYCLDMKSPWFIAVVVAVVLVLLSSCMSVVFGRRGGMKGGAVDRFTTIREYLEGMK